CFTTAKPSPARSPAISGNSSRNRSSRQSFPAASGWQRPPASASRSSHTTPAPKAPKAISNLRRKFSTMNKPETRKALGKGLGALVPTRPLAASAPPPPPAPPEREETALEVAIDLIEPNPLQARKIFASDRLEELAQSIRANGIIQPLVVRKAGEKYQLVAGERRWRAAKIAGISIVPIVIREIADERLLEIT